MSEEVDLSDEWNISALLPEGCMPLGFTAAIKYLNEDGVVAMMVATSAEIPAWERLGMHLTAVEDVKRLINTPDYDDD